MVNDNSYKKEIENCSFVKTILMLLVILYHSCVFWKGNWIATINVETKSLILSKFSDWLNSFHIYAFTLVSGYIFCYNINEEKKYRVYLLFIINKIKRLIIPFIFTSIIWAIPISSIICGYTINDIVYKYLLCTAPNQLWFLWMLFWVFFSAWPLKKIIMNTKYGAYIIAFVSYMISVILSGKIDNYFCILSALRYFPFFIIGMKIREDKELFLRKINRGIYFFLHLLLFFLLGIIGESFEGGFLYKIVYIGLELLLHVLGALMAFFVLQRIAESYSNKLKGVLSVFERCLMPMYLFHQQVIYICIFIFNKKTNPYINVIINFIISVIVSLLISLLLKRNNITKKLIGEK